ncbi:MAG TPA: hypothetical protein VK716_06695 [Terracidiphilus sp.]|nr:hypothetical protein [Terracidiphilus sp.]
MTEALVGAGLSIEPSRTGAPPLQRSSIFSTCANPNCRTGWLHLWRSRDRPVFEQGWTCSRECTEARIAAAVVREMAKLGPERTEHRHRIPIGLVLAEQGWISQAQLRAALEAQRRAGVGRLGKWLIQQCATDEATLTRALGLQWSCPVLGKESHDFDSGTGLMPRLFVDAYGALPLRISGSKVLYLAFLERPDRALALAVEQMTGLRVECGIAPESRFHKARAQVLAAKYPGATLIEAASAQAAAHALSGTVERVRPVHARLVGVHDFLWLRMSLRTSWDPFLVAQDVEDVICAFGSD